jgi:hypothetical protein
MIWTRVVDGYRRLTDGRSSATVLVLANLWELVGILFLGWDVFLLVFLFWAENLVVGFFTLFKILSAGPRLPPDFLRGLVSSSRKLLLAVYFFFHYGFFCLVHGLFVVLLVGGARAEHADLPFRVFLEPLQRLDPWTRVSFGAAVALLFASHGWSFAKNFIGAGERLRTTPEREMLQVYGRIVVLHVAILGGAFLLGVTGLPRMFAAVLVPAKIALDLRAHRKERERLSASGS